VALADTPVIMLGEMPTTSHVSAMAYGGRRQRQQARARPT
jgi:hypothetical protein